MYPEFSTKNVKQEKDILNDLIDKQNDKISKTKNEIHSSKMEIENVELINVRLMNENIALQQKLKNLENLFLVNSNTNGGSALSVLKN